MLQSKNCAGWAVGGGGVADPVEAPEPLGADGGEDGAGPATCPVPEVTPAVHPLIRQVSIAMVAITVLGELRRTR